MSSFNQMFGVISILIGLYALYGAYSGKGSIYKNNYPAEIKQDADKLLRIFLWILGPILLVQGAMDLTNRSIISSILIGIVFLLIITYLVIFYKRFGKALKKK